MTSVNKYILVLFSFLAVCISACQDKWEEHTELSESVLNENLMLQIQANPDLSKFNEYLVQTGYDELLKSTKTFTVWAPTNQALTNLDPAIVADPARLKNFVSNHLSNQRYFTGQNPVRIKMLSGKYLEWGNNQLDGVAIDPNMANKYSANGAVHVLTGAAVPRPNIYEFITTTSLATRHGAYIKSKNIMVFVPELAEIERIDPTTGNPVYKPGTGLLPRNEFYDRTVNIEREDTLYTQILLTDAAYTAEYNKIARFFNYPASADTMADLTNSHLAKDLVFKGLIDFNTLQTNDTLLSIFNVKVPINKQAIVQTIRTSNGIVYVMDKVDFRLKDKVPPIIIEGENPYMFFTSTGLNENRPDQTHRRYKPWASNQLDLRVSGHGLSGYNIQYRSPNTYSAKYKVSWKAVNDFHVTTINNVITRTAFSQRLALNNTASTTFPLKNIGIDNFNEVLLGEYTLNRYGIFNMFLIADGTNPLVLDYIKLEPVY